MVERLGWTLVHFVWEGSAVAILLAGALLATRRLGATVRYGLASAALAILAALPVATFLVLAPARTLVVSGRTIWTPGVSIQGGTLASEDLRLPLLVAGWAVGVVLLSLRLVGALLHVERWRRRHTRPAEGEWQERADALARRLGVRRAVGLLVSDRINVPSAWGVLRPLVVLPASLLAGLPPRQVESILLHELAHIRRHDYLVNLLQSVVETVLFYHPAVWWVSAVVRREREHCCDDLVVATLGDPMPYARALLHLEERRLILPRPTLSAKEGKLMNRIARILGAQPAPIRVSPMASTLAALGVLGAVLGGALQAHAQTVTKKPVAKPKPVVKAAPAPKAKKKGVAKPAPRPATAARTIKIVAGPGGRVRTPSTVAGMKSTTLWSYPVAATSQKTAIISMTTSKVPVLNNVATVGRPFQLSAKTATVTAKALVGSVNSVTTQSVGGSGIATLTQRRLTGQGGMSAVSGLTLRPGESYLGGMGAPVSRGDGGMGIAGAGERGMSGFGGATMGGRGFGATPEDISVEVQGVLVNVDVKDAGLSSVLRKLAKQSKLSFVVAPGNYDELTMVLSDKGLDEVVEIVCRSAGATFRIERGVYYISPRSKAP